MKKLLIGNEAVAWGLYNGGIGLVSSYPGTPSTEITEFLAKHDDIHSEWAPNEKVAMETAFGASLAGMRSACAMKHVGLNVAADPLFTMSYTGVTGGLVVCVADDPAMHSSQNEQDSRHYAIASKVPMLEPSDSAEAYEFAKSAFDLSEKYRIPCMLLADGTMGQMMEPVALPERKAQDVEKPWALTGTEGKRKPNIINSLALAPHELEAWNQVRFERYEVIKENEQMSESYRMDDAEICVVAFGIAARVSQNAVDTARDMGIKVGMIRPITLWPFPEKALRAASLQCKSFVSVELNMGQMIEDVRLSIKCRRPVSLCCRTGGMIPTPEEVVAAIVKANEGGKQA